MTVEDTDQVQDTDTTESTEETSEEETADKSKGDNQEDQNSGQSNEGEENQDDNASKEVKIKLKDGRELTPEELRAEYEEKLLPDYTRKSQALSEYQTAEEKRKAEASNKAQIASSELLKKVPPDVKEAIAAIAVPLFEQKLKDIEEQNRQKQQEKEQEQRDVQFRNQLSGLEKKYNGKNPEYSGIPKFDRSEVIKAMKDPENKIFDPELKFMDMHKGKFLDLEIKKALKKQGGGNRTEKTGQTDSKERGSESKKTPKTIREASQSFLARMSASEE